MLKYPYAKASATKAGVDQRASQGAGQAYNGLGGLGYIARRGIDFGTSVSLQTIEGVGRLAVQQPLELLSLLPDVVPEVGLAAWNGLRLGCGSGAVRIKAMTAKADGGSEEAADGTAAIDALWANLAPEVGDFSAALSQNFLMVMFAGMCAVEAVPGPRNTGIATVWPVNSLTLRFRRENDGSLALYQRQTANPEGIGVYSSGFGGLYVPMPMDRFFYASMDGFPDDPYGRPPFAAALSEVLRVISFMNDLSLAFHRVGMPRYDIGFDFEMYANLARETLGLTDEEAIREYVQKEFQNAVQFFSDLQPDDAFFHDIKSVVNAVGAGDKWPDLQEIFDIYRWRLIIALKQNPVLMGFVNGSTETWSDVQWEIYSKGTAAIVQKAAAPLVGAANLHLRLLGMPYKAEAEFDPIRSIQRLTDAQAESAEIANEVAKVAQNWQLNSTAAQKVTGSDCPTPEDIADDTPPKAPALPVTLTEDPAPPQSADATDGDAPEPTDQSEKEPGGDPKQKVKDKARGN